MLHSDVAKRAAGVFPRLSRAKSLLARLLEGRQYDGCIGQQDPIFNKIFAELHGPQFTSWIEKITGIDGLISDELLAGAGLHQGSDGSYLRLHADHNMHPLDQARYRRVNVLIYLNESWESAWNGDLELWDRQAISCRKRIEPLFNRCVIMEVDDSCFHGYGPLHMPSDRTRKALATYFYARAPAAGQTVHPHPTIMPRLHDESFISYWNHKIRRGLLRQIQKAKISRP